MKRTKKQKLLDAGYRVTDTKEFLGLSDSEAAIIELKITLVQRLREAWITKSVPQSDTTLNLINTLFALGVTPKELGQTIEQVECVTSAP